jgi:hypothetical protein
VVPEGLSKAYSFALEPQFPLSEESIRDSYRRLLILHYDLSELVINEIKELFVSRISQIHWSYTYR